MQPLLTLRVLSISGTAVHLHNRRDQIHFVVGSVKRFVFLLSLLCFAIHRVNLNTVTVAFDSNRIYEMAQSSAKGTPQEHPGMREAEMPGTEHAPMTAPSDTRPNVNTYRNYVTPSSTCAVEDTRSIHSNSDGSHDRMPRTNILSRMAKTKASWVENQKLPGDLPQRRSPILCKGRPLGSTSLTPFMENKLSTDKGTKGVRDGKKFDLLPISKYLAQYREDRKLRTEKRLPLVRISSYHAVCGFVDGLGIWDYSEDEPNQAKQTATFFTTKDVFKPYHARLLPTRGESLYIEPLQEKLNSYSANDIKLPRLYSTEKRDLCH